MKRLSAIIIVMALFVTSLPALAEPVNTYAYKGKFKNSNITVDIWFEEKNGIVSGEIVYTNTKQKTPIRILGSSNVFKGSKSFDLTEFQKDGLLTGTLFIHRNLKSEAVTGTWHRFKTNDSKKPSSYEIILTPVTFPKGKGGTLTYSTNPVGNYGFHYYDYQWEGELGGNVEIGNLKGNTKKKSVHIDNATHNIAECEENLVFSNGLFHGSIGECKIKYDVHVFKDFVYVEYTEYGEAFCPQFGEGASICGFYPKVK